jgi:predicted HTH domain antitoxin
VKLIMQEEEEESALVVSSFSRPALLLTYATTQRSSLNHVLNIIERRQWVRPYLEHYLGHGEDDRCGVLDNNPLSRQLTKRKEELLKIAVVLFERLVTFLRQSV